jgi:DNA recombination protein RmuC
MFLPFEGLFAEVLRLPGLFERLQREYRVTITGPTTLSAFLSSLQLGFRTLGIQKRSGEVWNLLASVKFDFGQFGELLDKTRKKLQEATSSLDDAGVKSRKIERSLKKVEENPQELEL